MKWLSSGFEDLNPPDSQVSGRAAECGMGHSRVHESLMSYQDACQGACRELVHAYGAKGDACQLCCSLRRHAAEGD